MNKCISQVFYYPVRHMKKIKTLTFDKIVLKDTQFFPSYLFMLITSAVCNLILAVYMIYFFFTKQQDQCQVNISVGIQMMAICYPIYQIFIFIILMISMSSTKFLVVRFLIFIFFTILATSFGFGGLAVIFLCITNIKDSTAVPNSFLTNEAFIQFIVVSTIVFVLMYVFVLPITTWFLDKKGQKTKRKGIEKVICIFHWICQILMFIGAIIFFAIIVTGIPLLFYLINGLCIQPQDLQPQILAFLLLCIIAPLVISVSVFFLSKFIGCKDIDKIKTKKPAQTQQEEYKKKKKQQQELENQKELPSFKQRKLSQSSNQNTNRKVLLQNHESKEFQDDDYQWNKQFQK